MALTILVEDGPERFLFLKLFPNRVVAQSLPAFLTP